ncbi:uncharacterized protein [Physcomitrium patens]|uniref:Sfi1 spindle body domain-containing protein n=1 Tax=Physcomitrium patens TaxID=3218 RepID=A0A7I4CK15_PHYPA
MASEEEIDPGESGLDPPQESLPPPNFPNGRRPSSGTDIGFEDSSSELAPEESGGTKFRSSVQGRRATSKIGSNAAEEAGSGRRKISNSGSVLKARDFETVDGRPPRRKWSSRRASKGQDNLDSDSPEMKELLRRLKEVEASSSSGSTAHAKLTSPKSGEHHRGIKALHRAVQENEMPMRLAYEQLDELAANAERVKSAIERNRSLLTLQVRKANERILRVAFMAWSLETEYYKQKKRRLKKAFLWSIRRVSSRAFKCWGSCAKVGKKMRRFESSAHKLLQRRKLCLTWKAWRVLIAEIHRKDEEYKKEKRLRKSLDKQSKEDKAKRAFSMMRRSNLCRYFRFLQEGVEARLQSRKFLRQTLIFLLKKSAFRAFAALREATRKRVHDRIFIKAKQRIFTLRRCFDYWWKSLEKNFYLLRPFEDNRILRTMFHQWRIRVKYNEYLRKRDQAFRKKLNRKMVRRCFMAYLDVVKARKCVRGVIARQLRKSNRKLLNRCFQSWIAFMQMGAQKKMQYVQRFASAAERENEKLRSDNERLSTIIDTGEWKKDRVSDLNAAQQVLSAERVALTKLIGKLQRQHQLALDQQGEQEREIKNLKDQLTSEMMTRGVSATPEVIYEVNKMAMDQVAVFPDGELHVRAMKPRNKGKWSNIPNPQRTPSVNSNRPLGSSVPYTPRSPLKPRPPSPPLSYKRYTRNTDN